MSFKINIFNSTESWAAMSLTEKVEALIDENERLRAENATFKRDNARLYGENATAVDELAKLKGSQRKLVPVCPDCNHDTADHDTVEGSAHCRYCGHPVDADESPKPGAGE